MFENSYLCEANIEAAKIILDRLWEKSKHIKNPSARALFLALSGGRASFALEYWQIMYFTHGC